MNKIQLPPGLTTLFTSEVGSHSWGYPGPYSDHDYRVVYLSSLALYLQLKGHADHVTPNNGTEDDVIGWDLSKFLILMMKNDRSTWEMLNTTSDDHWIIPALKELFVEHFDAGSVANAYIGCACRLADKELTERVVPTKKLLFGLYCVCAATVIREAGKPPPVGFDQLLPHVDPRVAGAVSELRERRAVGGEFAPGELWSPLVRSLTVDRKHQARVVPAAPYDRVFLRALGLTHA